MVRLINQQFLKVWQQYNAEGRKNRGLLSLMRRHQWRLSDEQHCNLMRYLAAYPLLQLPHVSKQKLVLYMLLKTVPAMYAKLKSPGFLRLIGELFKPGWAERRHRQHT